MRERVAVIGLGYIGLPLSLSFAMKGTPVIGVDTNAALVEEINRGITHHLESYAGKGIRQILQEELQSGRFRATTDYSEAIPGSLAIVVTVGIPIQSGDPDTSYLRSAMSSIGQYLEPGQVVIIRSTVIPGMTGGMLRQILEETSGLVAGEDFDLAYCSERIAEGKAFEEFESMPAVLAGVNGRSAAAAEAIIAKVTTRAPIYRASDMMVVEASKVFENVSRDVNIAMVQEFARFTEALGIDIHEVIRVANTHKRVNLLTPGPGVGGYCLPNALYYLLPKAEEMNVPLHLLRLARQINDSIPGLLVEQVNLWAQKRQRRPQDVRVTVLGIAMKDYSSDDRISPPLETIRLLQQEGYQVKAYDPAVPTQYPYKVADFTEAVRGADVIMILARQAEIPFDRIAEWRSLAAEQLFVVDTRNVYQAEELQRLKVDFWKI
ncbi:MAG: nucleotide sugar dehydrogenase [Bacillus thermozeamaize]|uniref:Nucleotide sugar dehydrogenase n=1 Tax=Bacillus thermozeamaize TaxID=230954 RepID=A0A1Y3PDE9_9BACI|nr:MAG: nucleotide sugar dehydrogenase [Bacillus thermozeamaize]